jgi:hypothetical protein
MSNMTTGIDPSNGEGEHPNHCQHAPNYSKTCAGAPPQDSQVTFYSSAEHKNISIAKEDYVLSLCLCNAFPSKEDASRCATEALETACNKTACGMSLTFITVFSGEN